MSISLFAFLRSGTDGRWAAGGGIAGGTARAEKNEKGATPGSFRYLWCIRLYPWAYTRKCCISR